MAEGEGLPLEEAFEKAWDNVPAGQKNKVHQARILVFGNNPINGYRVILSPTQENRPGSG
jgi:hypothetical protein